MLPLGFAIIAAAELALVFALGVPASWLAASVFVGGSALVGAFVRRGALYGIVILWLAYCALTLATLDYVRGLYVGVFTFFLPLLPFVAAVHGLREGSSEASRTVLGQLARQRIFTRPVLVLAEYAAVCAVCLLLIYEENAHRATALTIVACVACVAVSIPGELLLRKLRGFATDHALELVDVPPPIAADGERYDLGVGAHVRARWPVSNGTYRTSREAALVVVGDCAAALAEARGALRTERTCAAVLIAVLTAIAATIARR